MARDFYVGNTDHDWFDFCKQQENLTEVNFWQPSRQHFKALDEGGIFFFRRKAPINKIGGFGILASAGEASIETSWRDLGVSNGVVSKEDFIARVAKYKRSNTVDQQTVIGFKILTNPVFLEEHEWIDLPIDWANSIVSGKGYNADAIQARGLRKLYETNRAVTSPASPPDGFGEIPTGFSYGSHSKVRKGQNAFRMRLLSAYSNRCAVTGVGAEVCLEAAHIDPYSQDQNHDVSNGILLRADIHALFDANLLSINTDFRIVISTRLKEIAGEGCEYLDLNGKKIRLPNARSNWPSENKLAKHMLELLSS
mgnify:CR=1 FL=1